MKKFILILLNNSLIMKLQEKVSIVTGSGRGIGKSIALKFAEEGAKVVLISRTKDEIEQTLNEIEKNGGQGFSFQLDVSHFNEVENLIYKVLNDYGKIDILVNNAGIITPIKPIHKVDVKEWENNIQINLFGTFYFMKLVIPNMISNNYGKIINLSGGGAFNSMPNFTAYSVSKAAIIRLTETVAAELGTKNISVNAIAPGPIKTKITYDIFESGIMAGIEQNRAKKLIDDGGFDISKVCDLALFLASNESDGLSGKTISAKWDNLDYIKQNISLIQKSDKFTMKRTI